MKSVEKLPGRSVVKEMPNVVQQTSDETNNNLKSGEEDCQKRDCSSGETKSLVKYLLTIQ